MGGVVGRIRATLRVAAQVFRNPTLRRVELAFLLFNCVEYGSWVAVLLYAYDATGPASVGFVALAQLLPSAIAAPVAATLGDRYPRERVLLAGYLLLAALVAATAAGMLLGWAPLAVYVPAIGASMAMTFARPAQSALLPALARTPEELTAANAVSSIAEAGGLLLGPLAAAAILTVSTPASVLVALSAATVAAALLVVRLRPAPRRRREVRSAGAGGPQAAGEPGGRFSVILAGFRALATDGDARLVIAILAGRMLIIGVTDVLFVLLALDLFGTGESGAALLTAAMGAGGIIGGAAAFLLVGRRRIAPILVTCAVAWGATFAAMGVTASGTLAPLLLIAGGVGLTVMDVSGRTILQRGVRDEVLARVFGILEGLAMVALAVGSILVPVVVAVIGLRAAVLAFAALLPVLFLLAWPGLRGLDRRAVVPTRALALLQRLRLFEALDPPVMEALARAAAWETVAAGVRVIGEDEPGDRYYILESGAMRVTRGERHLRDIDTPGEGFGEVALLRDVPRTATVTALRGIGPAGPGPRGIPGRRHGAPGRRRGSRARGGGAPGRPRRGGRGPGRRGRPRRGSLEPDHVREVDHEDRGPGVVDHAVLPVAEALGEDQRHFDLAAAAGLAEGLDDRRHGLVLDGQDERGVRRLEEAPGRPEAGEAVAVGAEPRGRGVRVGGLDDREQELHGPSSPPPKGGGGTGIEACVGPRPASAAPVRARARRRFSAAPSTSVRQPRPVRAPSIA